MELHEFKILPKKNFFSFFTGGKKMERLWQKITFEPLTIQKSATLHIVKKKILYKLKRDYIRYTQVSIVKKNTKLRSMKVIFCSPKKSQKKLPSIFH